jgi:putative ubiquitin-RnfH superfamily antitoxin RatB of RatAB toxin-antitoxin module
MKIEVFWCEPGGDLETVSIEVPEIAGEALKVEHAVSVLPERLRLKVLKGELHLACFGQHRNLDSPLIEGDRLELLGPVVLDVKAERAARVKAARARARGPYNRGFSGSESKKQI